MMHPMAEFYPPTCLLCRHFTFWTASGGGTWTGVDPAEMVCAKDHVLSTSDHQCIYRAATCPDFDQITAAERDAMIQEAGK